ncbi:MAG: VIT family protein [Promethearchaeota archaeon]|nr:MAG: VIT family protein [Candidatus Lokiarchaeota archaeon]
MDLQQEEHKEGGGKVRSFILGFNDGLISVFTLLVGVAAAQLNKPNFFYVVILTGAAAMVSGAVSMGLGEYISSKSEYKFQENEIRRERAEIKLFPEEEKKEVKQFFKEWGFKGEQLDNAVETITSDQDNWIDFLTKSELGLEEPESPVIGGIITFFAFIIGSLTTLFPYFFNAGLMSLVSSSIISFVMLFIIGSLKTKITGEKYWKSGLEMVIVGIIAFIVSYGVGTWVELIVPQAPNV